MWPLPVRELFSVGRSAQKKLEGIGIHTIGQLAACDVELLKPLLGEKYAIQIHGYACGIDPSPVAEHEPTGKGYGNSTTLSRMWMTSIRHAPFSCRSARRRGAAPCRPRDMRLCLCEIKDWEFHVQSHQATLNSPTDSTTVLYENACRLLKEFWDLTPAPFDPECAPQRYLTTEFTQISLFESDRSRKMKEMEKAVDQIRGKFGTDIIKRASFLKRILSSITPPVSRSICPVGQRTEKRFRVKRGTE